MKDDSRQVMYHSWRHLTFLHWPAALEDLQRMLPPGLRVDTYEGVAYVGLVPFTMHSIRLAGLPAIPGLSASHETNVRTYVVDESGVPGVWFFSLDAENPAFVYTARLWYRLNYVRARMSLFADDRRIEYHSTRANGVRCSVETAISGEASPAPVGSLAHFLVERYSLYAYSRGRLLRGRVSHEPYPLVRATCRRVEEGLVSSAGLQRPDVEPYVLYSPGVDVEVFGIRRI